MAGPGPGAGGAAPQRGAGDRARAAGGHPVNGGSVGASIAQRAPQTAAPGQRCFTAMPGALPATSAPRTGVGTGLGGPQTPVAHGEPGSILTILPAAFPLHVHWSGARSGAGSPKPDCLRLRGVSQLPSTYQDQGRNLRPPARDGPACADGELQV